MQLLFSKTGKTLLNFFRTKFLLHYSNSIEFYTTGREFLISLNYCAFLFPAKIELNLSGM
jgi:hypothetical protein